MPKYNITTKLPTLNEYIQLERSHRYKASAVKKKYTDICGKFGLAGKRGVKKDGKYSLILNWTTTTNKADPDNIFFGIKFILDGLVKYKVLANDGRKNIQNIHHNIQTGKKYNIEVNLIEEE